MQVTTIGLDIAKNSFQVHGTDAAGETALRKKLVHGSVLRFFATLPRCVIGLEACGGAHYWARELAKLGHEVRLMPPQYLFHYFRLPRTLRGAPPGLRIPGRSPAILCGPSGPASAPRKFRRSAAGSIHTKTAGVLGRSLQDLVAFLSDLHSQGIDLYLDRQGIDTTTPAGKALFQMLGVFSELERSIIRERGIAGLDKARMRGKVLGRPQTSAAREAAIRADLEAGMTVREVVAKRRWR